MTQRPYIGVTIIIIMASVISFPLWTGAEEVGNFIRVEQRVDYQKGEAGPFTPAKVKTPVEVRDVVQTYDLSRAQLQFRDNSMIIIAPRSKVAIENYMFDPSKFERNARFNFIQGVMKVVVPVLGKGSTSEFTVKTSTATMGVRGTDFIVITGKNFTVVYATTGKVCIKSNVKEGEVCLDPGTMSVILEGQDPSTPQPVSAEVMALAEGLVLSGFNDIPGTCVVGTLPGVNLEYVANDLISRGADLESVKASLAAVCYAAAETYAYSPPGPPSEPIGIGPTFPGGGGGGGTGSGGVASPAK